MDRRVVLGLLAATALAAGATTTAALATTGSRPAPHSNSKYADYLEPAKSRSQCDIPPSQRIGGWTCYTKFSQ